MHALTLAFGWAPEIRGILFVVIIFLCLVGGTYLVMATNLGARLGFLVAFAGLFGWMFLMGAIWWVYGIGMQGTFPSWKPIEVVTGDLSQASLDRAHDLSEWESLSPDNPQRGQAQAAADEILTIETARFADTGGYQPVAVYRVGGETWPDYFFNLFHHPHYAIVQVQPVVPQSTDPGAAPPAPILDESQEPISVVMIRDLGDRRFPPFVITVGSGLIFAVACRMLHRRDKAVARAVADYEAGGDDRRELEKV